MRSQTIWNAGLMLVSLVTLPTGHACRAQGGGWQAEARHYGWQLDFESARRAAQRSGKPLMVVIRCVP